jgi:hypothetical protein
VARIKHPTIALNLPKSVPKLLLFGRHVAQKMTESPHFPEPKDVVTDLTAALDALEVAEVAALGRGVGLATTRDVEQRLVEAALQSTRAYVLAVAADDPGHAATIIASSGMSEKRVGARSKPLLEVVPGPSLGEAIVRAKAVARRGASYEWQMSSDGGQTWVTLGFTTMADTSVLGLTSGATYWFRFRSTVKRTTSAWSDSVSYRVP